MCTKNEPAFIAVAFSSNAFCSLTALLVCRMDMRASPCIRYIYGHLLHFSPSVSFSDTHYIFPTVLHFCAIRHNYPTALTFLQRPLHLQTPVTFCPVGYIFALFVTFIQHPLHICPLRSVIASSVSFFSDRSFHCPFQVIVTFLHALTLFYTLPCVNRVLKNTGLTLGR